MTGRSLGCWGLKRTLCLSLDSNLAHCFMLGIGKVAVTTRVFPSHRAPHGSRESGLPPAVLHQLLHRQPGEGETGAVEVVNRGVLPERPGQDRKIIRDTAVISSFSRNARMAPASRLRRITRPTIAAVSTAISPSMDVETQVMGPILPRPIARAQGRVVPAIRRKRVRAPERLCIPGPVILRGRDVGPY